MFWQFSPSCLHNTAVINGSQTLTYAQLQQRYREFMLCLPEAGNLVVLKCRNDLPTLVAWLACLNKKVPVLLLENAVTDTTLQALVQRFAAAAVVSDGKIITVPNGVEASQIDSRLAVMISTSGSTGSAKQVALSYDNLQANAQSICDYLPIKAGDVTITTLPFHYSYGLSVINTHLLSGATIVLSDFSIMSREFWDLMDTHGITSFAGVPYTFEMLKRVGFLKKSLPALRYVTQAGGRLSDDLVIQFAEHLQEQQAAFYVMYGQTEATARMAFLAPHKLPKKVGAIGNAIPGGKLSLMDEQKQPITRPNSQGELVYYGANIMLGYASCAEELTSFLPPTCLYTGDLAMRDSEGDYTIVGRVKRFVKIFGSRINLDEVEALLEQNGYYARVTGTDKRLYLALAQIDNEQGSHEKDDSDKSVNEKNATEKQQREKQAIHFLSKSIKLHPNMMKCTTLSSFPLKTNQKIDYAALLAKFEGGIADV